MYGFSHFDLKQRSMNTTVLCGLYWRKTESIIKMKEKKKVFTRTFLPKLNSLHLIRYILCTDRKEVDNVTLRYLSWQQNFMILQ